MGNTEIMYSLINNNGTSFELGSVATGVTGALWAVPEPGQEKECLFYLLNVSVLKSVVSVLFFSCVISMCAL